MQFCLSFNNAITRCNNLDYLFLTYSRKNYGTHRNNSVLINYFKNKKFSKLSALYLRNSIRFKETCRPFDVIVDAVLKRNYKVLWE